ncbi:hypothetical protein [Paenibacillus koleovorans]|uniref:hypothetical protein n=1 Tax=Paenibacillus koleovorans TaxID=121608 RepID=UPI0013E300BB|nr:hypothetical protein [Paenibacillus koleovorans]
MQPYIDGIPPSELDKLRLRHVLTKTTPKFFGVDQVEGEGLAGMIVKRLSGRSIAELGL